MIHKHTPTFLTSSISLVLATLLLSSCHGEQPANNNLPNSIPVVNTMDKKVEVLDLKEESSNSKGLLTSVKGDKNIDYCANHMGMQKIIEQVPMALNVNMNYQANLELICNDGTMTSITNNVKWNTNKTDIATITKQGLITANLVGKTNISYTYLGNKITHNLVVGDANIINLSLKGSDDEYIPGYPTKLTLNAKFIDDTTSEVNSNHAKWTSSDHSIATVDESGYIHPLKKGEVTITAKYNNLKTSLNIKVSDAKVVGFEFDKDSLIWNSLLDTYPQAFMNMKLSDGQSIRIHPFIPNVFVPHSYCDIVHQYEYDKLIRIEDDCHYTFTDLQDLSSLGIQEITGYAAQDLYHPWTKLHDKIQIIHKDVQKLRIELENNKHDYKLTSPLNVELYATINNEEKNVSGRILVTSSNPEVVEIEPLVGTFYTTIHKIGKTTLTATFIDENGKVITTSEDIFVYDIDLNVKTIAQGEILTPIVTKIHYDGTTTDITKEVTEYYSMDSDIIEVKENELIAKKPGIVELYVYTSQDGIKIFNIEVTPNNLTHHHTKNN